ncbi:hypothetical protein ACWEKM_27720 [Streptomyces sp. NPDC004752]
MRGEGFSLTTQLPVRIPQHGAFPSKQEAKDTAQRLFDRFVARIAPTTSANPPATALVEVLKVLTPPLPTDHRPTDATHHRVEQPRNAPPGDR